MSHHRCCCNMHCRWDVSKLEPLVAAPHSPDNRKTARECSDVKIDRVYIGSCTGERRQQTVLRGSYVIQLDECCQPCAVSRMLCSAVGLAASHQACLCRASCQHMCANVLLCYRWQDRGLHVRSQAVLPCQAPGQGAHLPGASHTKGETWEFETQQAASWCRMRCGSTRQATHLR
jgi:hypothetical protein